MSQPDEEISPQQVAAARWLAQYAPEWIAAEFVNHSANLKWRIATMSVRVRTLERQRWAWMVIALTMAISHAIDSLFGAIILVGSCLLVRWAWKVTLRE